MTLTKRSCKIQRPLASNESMRQVLLYDRDRELLTIIGEDNPEVLDCLLGVLGESYKTYVMLSIDDAGVICLYPEEQADEF